MSVLKTFFTGLFAFIFFTIGITIIVSPILLTAIFFGQKAGLITCGLMMFFLFIYCIGNLIEGAP